MRDPSHNSVDFSQRTAPPEMDEDQAALIERMRRDPDLKYLPWNDPVWLKRFLEAGKVEPAVNTTMQENARLRQDTPEEERSILSQKFDDDFWTGDNPEKWRRSHLGKL